MTRGSKFEVSKFDGHGNFGLWQTRVKDLLAQHGIQKGLRAEKPKGMEDDDWVTRIVEENRYGIIQEIGISDPSRETNRKGGKL
ncbi:Unknown protein [Striga hermonthica]|uniref:Uncharacterized protein n=1 Tax=Striga hermonthica TaxID=68872 RepID=A0A9N7NU07_STRHE|nr:Unknown protein [Striga hermonthica]